MPRISIADILEQQGDVLKLSLIAGDEGVGRYIDHSRLQKPSLAFAGFLENLSDYRLQVIGQTELHYLETREPEERRRVVDEVFNLHLAGVVITRGIQPPEIILQAAKRTGTPLIVSQLASADFMTNMTVFLSHKLAPLTHQHGVYVDVFGAGVLLMGESGIGKSEVGLELITRGHRLIADDMVQLTREAPDVLVGKSPESLRYHMEIRGLGVLDIRSIFGAAGITDTKRVRLIVDLIRWGDFNEEDRLMANDECILHEVKLPRIRIPVRKGRSLAVLVEVAVRNQLLKQRGVHSCQAFSQALSQRIQEKT